MNPETPHERPRPHRAYTALCETLARVGEQHGPLLLAMVSLSVMTRQADADQVLRLISQTEAACAD